MTMLSPISAVSQTFRTNLDWLRTRQTPVPDAKDERSLNLRLRNGRSVSLRGSVRAALNDIFLYKIYDVPDVVFRQCREVFDLGAGTGLFAVYVASQAPNAAIHCFEASGADVPLLQRNLADNTQRAQAYRTGVCAVESSLSRVHAPGDDRLDDNADLVPYTGFADLFALTGVEVCDFLKMDIGGEERSLLLETPFDVLRRVRVMAIRWHYAEEDLPRVRLRLAAAGFKTMAHYAGPGRCQIMLKAWRV